MMEATRRGRYGLALATVGVVGAIALLCCLGVQHSVAGEGETAPAGNAVQQLAEKYPLEYGSYMAGDSTDLSDHDHTRIVDIMEAPVLRDEDGYFLHAVEGEDGSTVDVAYYEESCPYLIEGVEYDPATNRFYIAGGPTPEELTPITCLMCKSHAWDDLAEIYGDDVFTMDLTPEVVSLVDGQYWDCAVCHDGDPAQSAPTARQMYFLGFAGEGIADIDDATLACGQCHNYYDYRSGLTSLEDFGTYNAYEYGFDADALFDKMVADGIAEPDEATGLISVGVASHTDLEMFVESTHYGLGLSCVTCHMPKLTSEDGTQFTDHNASGSPIEKEAGLELCLGCHAAQGIENAEDMVAMVEEVQASAAERENVLEGELAQLEEAYLAALDAGELDAETLAAIADDYSRAHWYVGMCSDGETVPGVKAAMFNDVTCNLLDRADAKIADAWGLLGA